MLKQGGRGLVKEREEGEGQEVHHVAIGRDLREGGVRYQGKRFPR